MNSPRGDRCRAVAGVWVALFGLVMTLFVGLAIDTSFYDVTITPSSDLDDP